VKGWRKWKRKMSGLQRPDIPARTAGAIVGLGLVLLGLAKIVPGMSWRNVGKAWLFLLYAMPFLFLAGVGVVLALAYQRGQERKVRDGLTTVHRRQIEQIGTQALAAHWQTELTKAGHAPVPSNFSGTWHVGAQQTELLPASQELPSTEIVVPTVTELLRLNELGQGRPIYMGVDAEQVTIRQRWKEDIGSFFVLGHSGAGKTTLALSTSVQIVLEAMRYSTSGKCLLIADPHYGDEESLGTQFEGLSEFLLAPIAESEAEILALSELMVEILDERLANPRPKEDPYPPIFGMFDEWLKIYTQMASGKKIDHNLSRIATEGRKKGMNAGFFTQMGTKEQSGNVRAQATSTLIFRSRADQARYAYGEKLPFSPRDFKDGEFYMHTRRLVVPRARGPYTSAAEVVEIGKEFGRKVMEGKIAGLPKRGNTLPEGLPRLPQETEDGGYGSGGRGERKYSGRVREDWEAKREYVLEALKSGVSVVDVRRTVLNVPSSGRDGQDARKWIEWLAEEETP
jgi:hypothetical protein